MHIFISYRHSDAISGTAQLLRERLGASNGKEEVFLDNASLPVGESFPQQLQTSSNNCDVFLALIDSHWLASASRLHDPGDWVRREIEVALQRLASGEDLKLIPVLLHDAKMPKTESLPAPLAALADLQALPPMRSESLEDDIELLRMRINGWSPRRLREYIEARTRAAWRAAAGVVLLCLATVVALFDLFTIDTRLEALTLSAADLLADVQPHPKLALVVIDEQTEQALGKPYMLATPAAGGPSLKADLSWRSNHAQLIERLSAAGARVVAFDIYLSQRSPEHDAKLLSAVQAARERGTTVIFGSTRVGEAPPLPPPAVQTALLCVGDSLGWSRSVPLVVRRSAYPPAASAEGTSASGTVYLSALSQLAALPDARVLDIDNRHHQVILQAPSAATMFASVSRFEKVTQEQACAALARGDEVAQRYIRFSPLEQLRNRARRFRYEDLVAGAAPLDDRVWEDKIVLVGVAQTRAGALDERTVLRAMVPEVRQGFEVHADAINTVLQEISIQRAPLWAQTAVLLGMAGLGMVGRFWRKLWEPWRGPLFCAAVTVGYLAVSAWMCAELNLLLDSSYHLAAMLMAYLMSSAMLRQQGFRLPVKPV